MLIHICVHSHNHVIFVLLIQPVYLLVPQCFFHLMCLLLSGSYFLSWTGKPTANLVAYTVLHHSLASVEGEAAKTGRFHQIASQSRHLGSLKNCLKQTNIMQNSNRGRNLMSTLASTCTCTACVTTPLETEKSFQTERRVICVGLPWGCSRSSPGGYRYRL